MGFHIHSTFQKDRTLMLGSSNYSCQENRSTYHMLLNHHHFTGPGPGPLLWFTLLHHYHLTPVSPVPLSMPVNQRMKPLIPRWGLYPGTPSKLPWSSEMKTCRGLELLRLQVWTFPSLLRWDYFVAMQNPIQIIQMCKIL